MTSLKNLINIPLSLDQDINLDEHLLHDSTLSWNQPLKCTTLRETQADQVDTDPPHSNATLTPLLRGGLFLRQKVRIESAVWLSPVRLHPPRHQPPARVQNCTTGTYLSFAELPVTGRPQTRGVNICRLWQLGVSGAWHCQVSADSFASQSLHYWLESPTKFSPLSSDDCQ